MIVKCLPVVVSTESTASTCTEILPSLSAQTTPVKPFRSLNNASVLSTPESNQAPHTNVLLTPNTRQRKHRLAKSITETVKEWSISTSEQLDVIDLALKQLNLKDHFQFIRKPTKSGRKLTPLHVRQVVWNFWHNESSASTITSRPAKIKVNDKPKIQSSLQFVDTVKIIKSQRNVNYYENIWFITTVTLRELYYKYVKENPENMVSYRTFHSLKPFYVRSATTRDVEMCCCKIHLHARWAIAALVECASKEEITLPFHDYDSFFSYLAKDCEPCATTYINWGCVIDKKTVCGDILNNWITLNTDIIEQAVLSKTVKLQYFDKVEVLSKKSGQLVKRLKAIYTEANMEYIINFINSFLKKIIFHRNQLKHYRSSLSMFMFFLFYRY